MFGAEPEESWTQQEQRDFEEYASADLRSHISAAIKAGVALLTNIVIIVPFLAGFWLHKYWRQARFLIFTADLLLIWFVIKVGFVWSSWQSTREVRRAHEGLDLAGQQPDSIRAHKHCMENRAEIEVSILCGCFYCMSIYPPTEIAEWIDDRESMTAECPRCGIDAVIGSASGFPITPEFLNLMNEHWFEGHRSERTNQ